MMSRKRKRESIAERTAGIFKSDKPALTIEEMRSAAEQAAAEECMERSGLREPEAKSDYPPSTYRRWAAMCS